MHSRVGLKSIQRARTLDVEVFKELKTFRWSVALLFKDCIYFFLMPNLEAYGVNFNQADLWTGPATQITYTDLCALCCFFIWCVLFLCLNFPQPKKRLRHCFTMSFRDIVSDWSLHFVAQFWRAFCLSLPATIHRPTARQRGLTRKWRPASDVWPLRTCLPGAGGSSGWNMPTFPAMCLHRSVSIPRYPWLSFASFVTIPAGR